MIDQGFDVIKHWTWLATTLNPYYEGNCHTNVIKDDRLISRTIDNWYFGMDNSGSLLNVKNMQGLIEMANEKGKVELVTADGSVDCSMEPERQETVVSRLHQCEVVAGCLLLEPGGSLVVKMFTLFESSSVTLLYFLNCMFSRVTVFKPAVSKPGNSEVYIICSDYHNLLSPPALLSIFTRICNSTDDTGVLLPLEDVPEDFLADHCKCCHYFMKIQIDTISRNLQLFNQMTRRIQDKHVCLQDRCVDIFIRVCDVRRISDRHLAAVYRKEDQQQTTSTTNSSGHFHRCQNFPGLSCRSSVFYLLRQTLRQGSFCDLQQLNNCSWSDMLHTFEYSVPERCEHFIRGCRRDITCRLLIGGPVKEVVNCIFLESTVLTDMRSMFRHGLINVHQQKALAEQSRVTLAMACRLLKERLSTTPVRGYYYYGNDANVTSPCYRQHSQDFDLPQRIAVLGGLRSLGAIGLVVDVTGPDFDADEELHCQERLTDAVHSICSHMGRGSSMVLIMPVPLTRLSAGLVYCLHGLFSEVWCLWEGPSLFLHTVLCFHHLACCPPDCLLQALARQQAAFPPHTPHSGDTDGGDRGFDIVGSSVDGLPVPLELVPVREMFSDRQFAQFMLSCCQYTVRNFLATAMSAELDRLRSS